MNKTKWLLAALVVCSLLMSCGTDADYDDMDGETAEETESIDMANDGLGGDVPERGGSNTEEVQKLDVSHLGGMWLPDTVGETDYLEIRPDDSTFTLYGDYGQIDGWFGYDDTDQTVYAYDTDGTGCVFEELEDGDQHRGLSDADSGACRRILPQRRPVRKRVPRSGHGGKLDLL